MKVDQEIKWLKYNVPYGDRLTQLAEECAELAQAALKMRRAMKMGTPTVVTPAWAKMKMMDKMADVLAAMLTLVERENIESGYISDQMAFKIRRWVKQMEEQMEGATDETDEDQAPVP